jgi:hypothetical protein
MLYNSIKTIRIFTEIPPFPPKSSLPPSPRFWHCTAFAGAGNQIVSYQLILSGRLGSFGRHIKYQNADIKMADFRRMAFKIGFVCTVSH